MGKIVHCGELADKIMEKAKDRLDKSKYLCIITTSNDPASAAYVKGKQKDAEKIGMNVFVNHLDSKSALNATINDLNKSTQCAGILVQLPSRIPFIRNYINGIKPQKDVDGLTTYNRTHLMTGRYYHIPCTAKGIMEIAKYMCSDCGDTISGKNVVILGRSDLVGKPTAILMEKSNATVTLCHSKTRKIAEYTRLADILVVAVGYPNLIRADMIKPGAMVIDAGINNRVGEKLIGDVDFEEVKEKASYITPVPGGVGLMTRAMLIENTANAMCL